MLPHNLAKRGGHRLFVSLVAAFFAFPAIAPLRALVDTDKDGVSDIWCETYPNAGAATADPDGDGATNLAESLAGTNPFDRTSRLVASAPETDASGNTLLRWSGVSGKRYRIDSSTDLTSWTEGTELLTAAQSPRLIRAAGAIPRPRQFWRVTALDADTDADGVNDWEESRLGSDPAVPAIPLQSHFVPFGMCFGSDLTAAQQIARCQTRGFTGLASGNFDLGTLQGYAQHPDVVAGRFKIYGALWFVMTEELFAASVLTDIEPCIQELGRLGAYLWMCCNRNNLDSDRRITVANVQKVADLCARHGVTLVLYPHGGCAFYCAEQTKSFLPQINRPNVRISIHLCHEIMAGNGARIAAVVAAVRNDIVLASVSGSAIAVNENDNWASQIKPLDRGDYDIRPYLQALTTAGYSAPMTLMTYNLGDPGATPTATDHLTRSLKKWRTLVAPTAHRP